MILEDDKLLAGVDLHFKGNQKSVVRLLTIQFVV